MESEAWEAEEPSPLAIWGANVIRDAFNAYIEKFREITARARARFEARDWRGHQKDAYERLSIVTEAVTRTVRQLEARAGPALRDRSLWMQMRPCYAKLVRNTVTAELAETFYNSVTRRIFTTVGVDPDIEFVEPACPPPPARAPIHRTFMWGGSTEALLRRILETYAFSVAFRDITGDARAGAQMIDEHFASVGDGRLPEEVDFAYPIFYRGKGAYLVGRARRGHRTTPLILALLHEKGGVRLDAVLPTEKDARVLFSFAHSYFHVNVERPAALVGFVQSILPIRRRSELYIALGYNKHGKTELYRELKQHVAETNERFVLAEGDRGLVMIVFTLPSLELVFKVIRREFAPPKSTSREEVKHKYDQVFRQDRAGRLADAQEFEHLAFRVERFDPALLKELLEQAEGTVRLEDDCVVIEHLYIEKRVRPLNLYLREAPAELACAVVVDYGRAIRDLAATNTFPGDLLLKNFGVTRNGRVIFYDYDEFALVTECNFREMPRASSDEEEMRSEAWFYVAPNDVFPEEFLRFLGLSPEQQKTFLETHGELLTSAWWRSIQAQINEGEIVDIFPYPPHRRLGGNLATSH